MLLELLAPNKPPPPELVELSPNRPPEAEDDPPPTGPELDAPNRPPPPDPDEPNPEPDPRLLIFSLLYNFTRT